MGWYEFWGAIRRMGKIKKRLGPLGGTAPRVCNGAHQHSPPRGNAFEKGDSIGQSGPKPVTKGAWEFNLTGAINCTRGVADGFGREGVWNWKPHRHRDKESHLLSRAAQTIFLAN